MYVIIETDKEINTSVIGVATDLPNVHRMITGYFGNEAKEIDYKDIRDSGIEFEKTFYMECSKDIGYYSVVTVLEFTPNEI